VVTFGEVGYGFLRFNLISGWLWRVIRNQHGHGLGGGYLLWLTRSINPRHCDLWLLRGLILASGGTWSLSRIAYGIVSLASRLHPRWGYAQWASSPFYLAACGYLTPWIA